MIFCPDVLTSLCPYAGTNLSPSAKRHKNIRTQGRRDKNYAHSSHPHTTRRDDFGDYVG